MVSDALKEGLNKIFDPPILCSRYSQVHSLHNHVIKVFIFSQGGDPIEFKKINDAYNRLISHTSQLERIEAEAELSRTSVIIEISKQAVPKWKDRLKGSYGPPITSKVNNLLFNGPYNQYRGKGRLTGPIVLILYEDPEDQIPKIVCRCDNYMAWIQEQRMPLHLHVEKGKEIRFNQVSRKKQ